MFKEAVKNSNVIEFVSEETSDDVHRLIVRVKNEKRWPKVIFKILKTSDDDEEFGVSIVKEFFLDEDSSPAFIWVLSFWGDLTSATKLIVPVLSKRAGPPPAPKSVAVGARTLNPGSSVKYLGGGVQEITVPLPHRRGNRDRDTEEVVKIGEKKKGIRATVRGIT